MSQCTKTTQVENTTQSTFWQLCGLLENTSFAAQPSFYLKQTIRRYHLCRSEVIPTYLSLDGANLNQGDFEMSGSIGTKPVTGGYHTELHSVAGMVSHMSRRTNSLQVFLSSSSLQQLTVLISSSRSSYVRDSTDSKITTCPSTLTKICDI